MERNIAKEVLERVQLKIAELAALDVEDDRLDGQAFLEPVAHGEDALCLFSGETFFGEPLSAFYDMDELHFTFVFREKCVTRIHDDANPLRGYTTCDIHYVMNGNDLLELARIADLPITSNSDMLRDLEGLMDKDFILDSFGCDHVAWVLQNEGVTYTFKLTNPEYFYYEKIEYTKC